MTTRTGRVVVKMRNGAEPELPLAFFNKRPLLGDLVQLERDGVGVVTHAVVQRQQEVGTLVLEKRWAIVNLEWETSSGNQILVKDMRHGIIELGWLAARALLGPPLLAQATRDRLPEVLAPESRARLVEAIARALRVDTDDWLAGVRITVRSLPGPQQLAAIRAIAGIEPTGSGSRGPRRSRSKLGE